MNYTPYHIHTMYSNGTTNVDSVTDYKDYIDKAVEYGMTAIAFSEHGNIFSWLHKKEYAESKGLKYIHAVEAYLTETLDEKVRDNYHCILIAKNYDGVRELNKLTSSSFNRDDNHFYYVPRISFNELFSTSDNIMITSACLGGVLNHASPMAKEEFIAFMTKNKHRCFLEIQHHNCPEQIEYNRNIYTISQSTGIPLIVGTDSHAINEEHSKGRSLLQQSKKVTFEGEQNFDLVFHSYDELIEIYTKQGSLPMNVVKEALENTNMMASYVESFEVDYKAKYPKLYENSEEIFKQKINEGYKSREIYKLPNAQEYLDRIRYEFETYKHNGAIDFMLLEENYKKAMREKGVRYGYSRGSVSGSIIAYLLYITEMDSVKYNLNFERFMNKERISLADVDTDWYSEDREIVKQYLYYKEGLYCCDIITFNTIALKGAIDDVCRGLYKHGENDKQYLDIAKEIKTLAETDEAKAREKYKEVFEYVDILNGVIVSIGNHPAGCVVSPFPVDDWFGTCTTSTNKYPISSLNMKEIDSLNFVKLDILGLDNVGLIYKTCDEAKIPYITPGDIDSEDVNVWDSIKEDTTLIFQWESDYAHSLLKDLFSPSTINKIKRTNPNFSYIDLFSMGNGAIRPAGDSYRIPLSHGEYKDNGCKPLNDFLKPTLGYCIEGNQFVETTNGEKKIKDIKIGDVVYTANGVDVVTNVTNNGIKHTIKISTNCGVIECTEDHRILSEYGWADAGSLNIGDTIAYRVGTESTEEYEEYKLKLIGYLLGDGSLNNRNSVSFINKDIDVINDFCNCVKMFDNCTTSIINRGSRVNHLDLYCANVKHIIQHKAPTSLAIYLMDIGLKRSNGGCTAKDKFIPDFVWGLNKNSILILLGAYTDTDCCVKTFDNKLQICYKTSSEKLSRGLVRAIRMCGYVANSYFDSQSESYAVVVANAISFANDIYPYSYKIRKNWSESYTNRQHRSYDSYFHKEQIVHILKNNNISLKKICKEIGTNFYTKNKDYITIKTLRKINEKYPNIIPSYMLNDNLKFVKIIGVEDNGEKEVFDLTINDEHNFLCNGFVVHNCVYQEQVIEFLNKFCGYTMGEADMVRRSFAKKTGTEKHIPQIKEGFCKTMLEKYNMPREQSEKIVQDFLQVIIDASNYLFSKNHSDPYSWIGYICGWLRYYYPLEFLTTALNLWASDQEKSAEIIAYANKKGIKIMPIKFRHSQREYSFDKENNVIYKGIASIKYLNGQIADELLTLKDNEYDSFTDLLKDIGSLKINSKQLNILIELNFFEEFGDVNKLLEINRLFGILYNKSISPKVLETAGLTFEQCKEYMTSAASKSIKVDAIRLINSMDIKYKPRELKEDVKAQIDYLGYVDIIDSKYDKMIAIVDVDSSKYNVKCKTYALKTGKTIDMKLQKKIFQDNQFKAGDILKILGYELKPKSERDASGNWVAGKENEIFITRYNIL